MTEETDAEKQAMHPPIFVGASRAAGYVEGEKTLHGTEAKRVLTASRRVRDQEHPVPHGEAPGVDEIPAMPPTGRKPRGSAANPPAPTDPSRRAALADELDSEPTTDVLLAELTGGIPSTEKRVATKGARGVLAKVGIRLAPSPAELVELNAADQERNNQETIRQTTWTRAVGVLVANPKGGTGKTPVSLLLGGTLATIRGGSVAIMEVSDDPGALAFRAEGKPQRGLGELVPVAAQVRSVGQLAGYTAPQTSYASVIGSVGRRPRLSAEDVRATAKLVDEFYAIRVMDSGNQLSSSSFEGAVGTADALVIPVLNAGDAVLEALGLLDALRESPKGQALARRAVIVRLADGRPEQPQVMERINRIIEGAGVFRVHEVPYDAHIAERGQLTLAKLAPATRRAFVAVAASVVDSLQMANID
ncbi:MAG: hypothetical protein ABI632_01885 [Pseudolysinimonas sp.]